jgi:hypothetical protein
MTAVNLVFVLCAAVPSAYALGLRIGANRAMRSDYPARGRALRRRSRQQRVDLRRMLGK